MRAKNRKKRDEGTEKQPDLPSWNITPEPSEFTIEEPKGGRRKILVHEPNKIDMWR